MRKTTLLALALAGLAWAQPKHPLDPLSQEEMSQMVAILKQAGKTTPGSRFPLVTLEEPSKAEVRNFKPGQAFARRAFAVILDHQLKKVFEAEVDLKQRKVLRYDEMAGKQPGVLVEEFETPAKVVRENPEWQAAIKKRGIDNFEHVQIDTWAAGLLSPEDHASGRRFLRCLSFYRGPNHNNPYYRPIEGVVALVDPVENKVIRVEDTGVIAPINKGPDGELDEKSIARQLGGLRPALKPFVHSQPEGSSIKVDGYQVSWDRWRFRYAMHPREGCVLYDLEYQDKGEWRKILYRGSLSEMVVPYGDNASNWYWRNAFDLGEYGVGRLSVTMRPGYEVPSYALMRDSAFAGDDGKAYVQKNNLAIYEKEVGVLWKHQDYGKGGDQSRPARNLYLTYVATVGNYDYALSWVLGQDGSVGVDGALTGIVLAKGVDATRSQGIDAQGFERLGRLVGKNIVAPNHQHFFNFRLDLDIDGPQNSLYEINNQALPPGPENPALNAFERKLTQLKSEGEAGRDMNMHSCRSWMVVNPNRTNALGQSTGYQLMPGENSVPYLHPEAPVYQRAGFLKHHLWGTRYHPEELYASGDYPNQSTRSMGLPGWREESQSLDNQDLVLWYVFGVTHNPRPEEWPIMPAHRTGFKLLPNGFFDQNPCYDVPNPKEVRRDRRR